MIAERPEKLLFRVEEAARDVLGIGRSKAFDLIASGELPSVQIGRSRRITRTALEDYVARLAAASQDVDSAPQSPRRGAA
jgi:excisionase family DNA binding protein